MFYQRQFRQDENGYFIYCGRADDLLKVGGIFVSPIEVENCLLGHPDVEECCVLGFEEGLMKAMACVVLRDGAAASDATAESLRAHKGGTGALQDPAGIQVSGGNAEKRSRQNGSKKPQGAMGRSTLKAVYLRI